MDRRNLRNRAKRFADYCRVVDPADMPRGTIAVPLAFICNAVAILIVAAGSAGVIVGCLSVVYLIAVSVWGMLR